MGWGAGAVWSSDPVGAGGAGLGADQRVVGDGVHEVSVEAKRDSFACQSRADGVCGVVDRDEVVAVDGAFELDGVAGADQSDAGVIRLDRVIVPLSASTDCAIFAPDGWSEYGAGSPE